MVAQIMFSLSLLGILTSLTTHCLNKEAIRQFNKDISSPEAIKKIGYDPQVELLQTHKQSDQITVYFHGRGITKDWCKKQLPSTNAAAIIFNFIDAASPNPSALSQLTFGQFIDIKPTLFVLQAIAKNELANIINLVGISRGATVVINTIGVLNNPQDYQRSFDALGITDSMRKQILAMIERGIIVLDCPMTDIYEAIFLYSRNVRAQGVADQEAHADDSVITQLLRYTFNASLWCFDHLCTTFLQYVYLPIVCYYKPWNEDPFHSAKQWRGLNLTTIVRYEKDDPAVGNSGDDRFYKIISDLNPQTTFKIVTAEHQGHCSYCQELVNFFKEKIEYTC